MKKMLKIWLFAGAVSLASCVANEIEYDKGETPLTFGVSTDNAVLDIRNPDAEAISFTWTSGTNKGTNAAIEYSLSFDRSSNNFSEEYVVSLGRNIFAYSLTNAQLNTLMMDVFGAAADEEDEMAVRLTAKVFDDRVKDQSSDIRRFNVKTYQPVSSTLFMIGSATPGGWSLDLASEMTPITGLAGGFTWTGKLNAGSYKFIPTKDGFTPSYNLDPESDGTGMLYRTAANGVADLGFSVADDGYYRVTANLINLTAAKTEVPGPRFDHIYLQGGFGSGIELTHDTDNLFLFRYGAFFDWNGSGEIWFSTETGETLRPVEDNVSISSPAATFDGGANKWVMTQSEAGHAYKIVVDITAGSETMTMTRFNPHPELWMVGSATPGGWDLSNATPMTVGADGSYSWEGTLAAGEMKITCDRQSDWFGVWIMPLVASQTPQGDTPMPAGIVDMINNPDLKGIDRKWTISAAGTYRINGSQATDTIIIELL